MNYCIIAFFQSQANKITLISSTLSWQALLPDEAQLEQAFSTGQVTSEHCLPSLQPRLLDALIQIDPHAELPLLLIRCEERLSTLKVIATLTAQQLPACQPVKWAYHAVGLNQFQLQRIENPETQANVYYADWIESDQLFGCLRSFDGVLTPELGVLQQVNGGTLILSIRTLLAQPLMWMRLKKFLTEKRFAWLSPDERHPLPISLPDMPLSVSLILCGDRDSLAQFSEFEPELHESAIYTEIEEILAVRDDVDLSKWAMWVRNLAHQAELPEPDSAFLIRLYREATRYSGDQSRLPIKPAWILQQLRSAYAQGQSLTAQSLTLAIKQRYWRESYLPEAMQADIAAVHSLLESKGEKVGQINGLSVLDLPGHPRPWGEPSRISCVVHYGDGEINDVERKAELSGNLHTKGMMIIEAWLIAELELEQQLPFSASMVFEQSYAEVDGDSASLAELAVLISALASKPIQQSIAVTGSVDQFGNVQPVGGLNEKIEGFYHLCQMQGLTGVQGVILPERNGSHLSLSDEVIEAIKHQQFFLWPVRTVEQALNLLMQLPWKTDQEEENLLEIIQDRIDQALQPSKDANRLIWPLRWLNWFKR